VRRGDSSYLKYESNNGKDITLRQIYEKYHKHEKIGQSREIGGKPQTRYLNTTENCTIPDPDAFLIHITYE